MCVYIYIYIGLLRLRHLGPRLLPLPGAGLRKNNKHAKTQTYE